MPLILVIIQLQIFSRPVPLGIVLPRACSRMARIAVAFAAASLTFAQTPQFSSSGVVNAASYAQPITPGSLVSIFGTNLANATASASQLPLTTELSGTSVTVNGVKAPLLFVSPEQINLETPSTTGSHFVLRAGSVYCRRKWMWAGRGPERCRGLQRHR